LPEESDQISSPAGLLSEPRGPIVIGHRGASRNYPENTLLSLQKAVQAGAHALEFDVRCSRDGIPVVIHDAAVERTTDGSGQVAESTIRELRRLNAGNGERIPMLAEVLDTFRELPLLIDVKDGGASIPIIDVLAEHGAKRRVVVGAFEHAVLGRFREASIRTAASRRETATWWAASRIGAPPPRSAFSAFSVPERSGRIHVVDQRFLRRARRRGIPVHVWTVDDGESAARLWSWGVTGIITNCPSELVGILERTEQERTE